MHHLAVYLIDFLVTIFLVGIAGSAVVVLLSFVEDFQEIFGDDDSPSEDFGNLQGRVAPHPAPSTYVAGSAAHPR